MSEYLRKKAVLNSAKSRIEWFRNRSEEWKRQGVVSKQKEMYEASIALEEFVSEIQSGAFDANGEVQRLRAENERYRKALERIAETDIPYAPMTEHSVFRFYEQVAREALASTPTEPSGAEGDENE